MIVSLDAVPPVLLIMLNQQAHFIFSWWICLNHILSFATICFVNRLWVVGLLQVWTISCRNILQMLNWWKRFKQEAVSLSRYVVKLTQSTFSVIRFFKKKPRIILLLTRITSFHVYVLERYDVHGSMWRATWMTRDQKRIIVAHCVITLWHHYCRGRVEGHFSGYPSHKTYTCQKSPSLSMPLDGTSLYSCVTCAVCRCLASQYIGLSTFWYVL